MITLPVESIDGFYINRDLILNEGVEGCTIRFQSMYPLFFFYNGRDEVEVTSKDPKLPFNETSDIL